MKKNLIAVALVAGICSTAAMADDGEIKFVGAITDDACTVVNPVGTPLTVTLGTVSRSSFTSSGDTASPTQFAIKLTGCPAALNGKTAKVKFDGLALDGDNKVLALTQEAGVAKNVGIQLSDSTNAVVSLFEPSSAYALKTGDNTLDFVARYYATANNAAITAGPANSTATFNIIYN